MNNGLRKSLCCALLLFSLVPTNAWADEKGSSVIIDGKTVPFDMPPRSLNDITVVPAKTMLESLGAKVDFDPQTNQVTATKGNKKIVFSVGKNQAIIDGKMVEMNGSPMMIENRIYIPVQFVQEALGISLGGTPDYQQIIANEPYSLVINGLTLHKDNAVFHIGDEFYVSLQLLAPHFGYQVEDNHKGEAIVTYNGKRWVLNAENKTDMQWSPYLINDQIYVPISKLQENIDYIKTDVNLEKRRVAIYKFTTPQTFQNYQTPSSMTGKFLFIWKADHIQDGDVTKMIDQAKKMGIDGVIIKFADGSLKDDKKSQAYMAQFKRLVGPFKKSGFKVGGWIYQYLTDVDGEVDACSQAIDAGADFIVLDAEEEVKGKEKEVADFGHLLRAKYPNEKLALSSYAFANIHTEVPFDQYNRLVDVMMPQIYWADIGWNVDEVFNLSLATYARFGKPLVVTGQSYDDAKPEDISRFKELSQTYGIKGVTWWNWDEGKPDQLSVISK